MRLQSTSETFEEYEEWLNRVIGHGPRVFLEVYAIE